MNSRRFPIAVGAVMAVYVWGWASRWTLDPRGRGEFMLGRFWVAQAEALLRGRLWVLPADLPGECFYSDGRCYGYFGIVPSLLRVPFLWFTGPAEQDFAPVFMALAAGIAVWAAVDLVQRVAVTVSALSERNRAVAVGVAGLLLGPASVLVVLADPYLYQEAILWGVAGSTVAANLVWRWSQEHQGWQLTAATAALVVAAGSRPTYLVVGLVLAFGLWWLLGEPMVRDRRLVTRVSALAFAPILFTCGVYYLKFGRLLPSFDNYETRMSPTFMALAEKNGGQMTGPRFIPTNLFAYLRPDALMFSSKWPWLNIRSGVSDRITYLPPLVQDSMYVERTTSITVIMPLACVATIASFVVLVRRWRTHKRLPVELAILGALCTPPLVVSLNFGNTARYLGDFYPLVAVGMAFSVVLVPRLLAGSIDRRRIVGGVVVASIVYSTLVAAVFVTQYAWIWRFGKYQP